MRSTRTRRDIAAPRDAVFRALLDPDVLALWRAPRGMTCRVAAFEPRVGGAFRISLAYDEASLTGKTSANVDTYHGHFAAIEPDRSVVEVVEFETDRPELGGTMTVTTTLSDGDGVTLVEVLHEGIPAGVRLEDNELGTSTSLDKLAAILEGGATTRT